ncbi:MAG TPA: hypothetical protein VMD55_01635 [Terracidiphilus sp.]|nr:hypothetical protein [Terracidiphilus sp.]
MQLRFAKRYCALVLLLACATAVSGIDAHAAACTTQAQMSATDRSSLEGSARTVLAQVESGDEAGLQANTIPAVAADFSGIRNSVEYLRPLVERATITVDSLYLLDASDDQAGEAHTDFYCGSPVVVIHFTNLPPAVYALAIVHATGIAQPQQVALILSKANGGRWMLAGFFSKPMIAAGHDGLWYWISARQFAQTKMDWDAWLYYRMAANLLDPLDFLSSPNLDKLEHETDQVKPDNVPGAQPLHITTNGGVFTVTAIDTTTELGGLDLDVHYSPDSTQATELRNPPMAREQVSAIMAALLELHPELAKAFHGIWVHADEGNTSLFALELPMNQIPTGTQGPVSSSMAR